jgi:hypothetical protein
MLPAAARRRIFSIDWAGICPELPTSLPSPLPQPSQPLLFPGVSLLVIPIMLSWPSSAVGKVEFKGTV